MPRQLFEMFINASDNYALSVSLDDAGLAEACCMRNPVDLVLMDVVTKRGASGLDAAAHIKKTFPNIKIIIVTSMPEVSYIKRAEEIGVDSFWYKEVSEEPILSVMDRTMAGEKIYPDSAPTMNLGFAVSGDFTDRELEVLREMTGGYTNEEIAAHLYMSVNTVKKHIMSMIEKTGYKNRTELAVKARESGIVILDGEKDQ